MRKVKMVTYSIITRVCISGIWILDAQGKRQTSDAKDAIWALEGKCAKPADTSIITIRRSREMGALVLQLISF